MKKWFSLALVIALVSLGTSLEAGIFDRLVQDTSVEVIPLTDGTGDAVESHLPPPTVDLGDAVQGSTDLSFGYPFNTNYCETHHSGIKELWRGYCGRAHSGWAKNTHHVRGHGCKGGCGKGHCAHRACGKKGCSSGKCGHGFVASGKELGHVQQSHVKRSHVQRGHIQWGHASWSHVQHGKRFSGCHKCGKSPCDCHGKLHRQKNFHCGCHGKSCGKIGCAKGHAPGGCATARHGKEVKHHNWTGLFGRWHHCGTCGKSTIVGFSKGGCDCGAKGIVKGLGQEGTVIWKESHSVDVPYGQPTRAYDPPVELQIPNPVDTIPVPPTPTGYSAFMQRLRQLGGTQY